jgi:hypothetical protein
MTVGELMSLLHALDDRLPVVYKGPEYAANIPVEVTAVQLQAYIPTDAIVAREPVCVIEANPDAA